MGALRLTAKEQFEASKLLEENLVPLSEGFFSYKEGWSDQKIRDAIGTSVLPSAIRQLRSKLFGQIRIPARLMTKSEILPAILRRIDLLEQQVSNMARELDVHNLLNDPRENT